MVWSSRTLIAAQNEVECYLLRQDTELRSLPDCDTKVIGTLPEGTVVKALDAVEVGGWKTWIYVHVPDLASSHASAGWLEPGAIYTEEDRPAVRAPISLKQGTTVYTSASKANPQQLTAERRGGTILEKKGNLVEIGFCGKCFWVEQQDIIYPPTKYKRGLPTEKELKPEIAADNLDLGEIALRLFAQHMDAFVSERLTPTWRLEDYEIRNLSIHETTESGFIFGVALSVQPDSCYNMESSPWLAGDARLREDGKWIDLSRYIEVVREGNVYKMMGGCESPPNI